jgi:hypothetical protein
MNDYLSIMRRFDKLEKMVEKLTDYVIEKDISIVKEKLDYREPLSNDEFYSKFKGGVPNEKGLWSEPNG